ncbi:S41 family peptidase [Algoriphagus machipongonensis]|uniref:Tricorn protease homolog n=1 Tax=Algoriphagus machipongonensis TaxID=388413 RepID=A3HSE8_9BACT|nr:S41 family peptidase [Algoriphagus machipongonensis]EAZ82766.1 MdsD protein [Algoriphagus machipongonensis]
MKSFLYSLTICLVLLVGNIAFAQSPPKWMRYPAISPDGSLIAFTFKGDLFLVSSTGGDAKQLTFHEAHDYKPVWSKDGEQLAFASDRYGNFDVFIMSAQGGPATRLTFHSNDEQPFDFSADNQNVIFGATRMDIAEHRQYPTGSQPELYQVPKKSGRVDQIWTIPAEYVQTSQDGTKMIYHDKKGGENEWRKHHESGIARDIWLYDAEEGSHSMLTDYYGEDRNPVFSPDESEIYYLSEANGSFNVFAMPLNNPKQSLALTSLTDFPVRFLTISQDGLMSFGYDGELYTLRKGESPKKLEVRIKTQAVSNSDSYIAINGGVREMVISPNGKEIALIARGEVFVTSVDGSMTKRITNTPEQERFLDFSPDGKSLVYSSERDGKWSIYSSSKIRSEEPYFFASTLIEEKVLVSKEVDVYEPDYSPDGKKLAYVEDRRTLKVMDLESQESVTLMTPDELFHMRDGDQYFTWSPDSKWLLATYNPTMVNSEVVLLDATGKEPKKNLTKSGYGDSQPVWVNEGKQMLWFSNRDGMRSYATSGRSQNDVYSLFFDKESWDKFNLSKEDFDLMKEIEKSKKSDTDKKNKEGKDEEKKEVEPIEFDWDGLEERKARLTIHSSTLGDAVLSKDGEKLFYLTSFEKGMNLWSTNLRTKETKQEIALNSSYGSLVWDKDQKNLFLLSNGSISKINPESMKKESVKISGEMTYDAEEERNYMFEHIWLRTKGIFYTPDMHGVDWEAAKVAYEKYLPSIGNSYEFAEMISEMIGELNVSHAGARFSKSIPMADETASLGVFWDYGFAEDGLKIKEIIKGGPLDKADLDIKEGMVIQKIDGELISAQIDFAKLLNRKADKLTLLEVLDPSNGETQQVTIKPISLREENQLLYKRWVKTNQEEVTKLSDGKLGYVHIPGMSDGPYRNVYEEMMGKFHDTEGVIVDTRFNGGGDLVADLAMFFTGEKFLTYATEAKEVGYEPTARWTKPTLAMFNEANYSDGHCFACGYTDLGIGKTVGMPTPGTCSFAGWEGLPDGGRWGAVPISAKNKAGEWLENNETKPQFEIKNMPGKIDQGIDQQLEKAIEELLKDVD